jgi:hypothetical protein
MAEHNTIRASGEYSRETTIPIKYGKEYNHGDWVFWYRIMKGWFLVRIENGLNVISSRNIIESELDEAGELLKKACAVMISTNAQAFKDGSR